MMNNESSKRIAVSIAMRLALEPSYSLERDMFAVDIARAADDPRWKKEEEGFAYTPKLPRSFVEIETVAKSRCRILSYRWDFLKPHCSKNILVAIEYCIAKKLDYLFVDVVSIDQQLPRQQLIQRVAELKSLYAKIPVIAAYDNETEDYLIQTIRRPWITSEVLAYAENPLGVEYLSYMPRQGCGRIETATGIPYLTDKFDDLLKSSVSAGLANSAMLLLSSVTKDFDISDFGLICPPLKVVVDSNLSKISNADKLLLIALLLFAQKPLSGRLGRISYSLPGAEKFHLLEMQGALVDNHVSVQDADLSLLEINPDAPYSINFCGRLIGHLRTRPSYRDYTSIASHENRLLLKDNVCEEILHLLEVPKDEIPSQVESLREWGIGAKLNVKSNTFFWNQVSFEDGKSVASSELELARRR